VPRSAFSLQPSAFSARCPLLVAGRPSLGVQPDALAIDHRPAAKRALQWRLITGPASLSVIGGHLSAAAAAAAGSEARVLGRPGQRRHSLGKQASPRGCKVGQQREID